jgi:hypothetical protein
MAREPYQKPHSNVYTVLAMLAAVALLVTVVVVWVEALNLTGDDNPKDFLGGQPNPFWMLKHDAGKLKI